MKFAYCKTESNNLHYCKSLETTLVAGRRKNLENFDGRSDDVNFQPKF